MTLKGPSAMQQAERGNSSEKQHRLSFSFHPSHQLWLHLPTLSLSPHQRLSNVTCCLMAHPLHGQWRCFVALNGEWVEVSVSEAGNEPMLTTNGKDGSTSSSPSTEQKSQAVPNASSLQKRSNVVNTSGAGSLLSKASKLLGAQNHSVGDTRRHNQQNKSLQQHSTTTTTTTTTTTPVVTQSPLASSPPQFSSPHRIKNAALVQNSVLVLHRADNSICAHHLEFVEKVPQRQEGGYGTEKELLVRRQLVLGPAVELYHHVGTTLSSCAPSPTDASLESSSPNASAYPSPHSSLKHVNWDNVYHMAAAKEGIWIFSPHRTHYMSLHALFNTFHSNYSKLTCSDFPISTILAGSEKLPLPSRVDRTVGGVSSQLKRDNSGGTIKTSPLSKSPLTRTLSSGSTPLTPSIERDRYTHYLARVVHGISRELVTLDSKGILRVYSIHPLIRTKIIVNTLEFDSAVAFVQKHLKRANGDKNKNSSTFTPPIEMFFTHCHYLCIMNGDECLLFATKIRTFLGTVHLPSEIFVRQHQKQKESSGETPASGASTTMVWDPESSQNGLGIFSYDRIYRFDPPGIREVMQKWSLMPHASQIESKKHFADFLRELGHENWFVKMYLDIMMQEGKRSEISRAAKKKILDLLCTRLENPSLLWSSSNSLSEQSQIMDQVKEFLSHFPLDSEFWEQDGGTQKGKGKVAEVSKTTTPVLSHVSTVPPKQVFESMTWLNLSVAPKLAQSVNLADEQLSGVNGPLGTSPQQSPASPTDPPRKSKQACLLDVYSDIELDDNFDSISSELLVELCERYRLNILLQDTTTEQLVQHVTHELDLDTIQSDELVQRYLSCFESLQTQMQLAERERIKQHNQTLIRGFNHFDLLVRSLFWAPNQAKRLTWMVHVLERKQKHTLHKQEGKQKALDLTQKQHFEQLLQKDYMEFFSEILLDILAINNAIPHLDANLHACAVGGEMILSDDQVDTIGHLMQWAHRNVDLLKLYLRYEKWDLAVELMNRVSGEGLAERSTDMNSKFDEGQFSHAPLTAESSSPNIERLRMAQVLARCYAIRRFERRSEKPLPDTFKDLVIREMRLNHMSGMEYLDSLNRISSGAVQGQHEGITSDDTAEDILVDDANKDSCLTVEDLLPLLNMSEPQQQSVQSGSRRKRNDSGAARQGKIYSQKKTHA